jgi:DnaJ like chaperone protein
MLFASCGSLATSASSASPPPRARETDSVRKIIAALDRLEPERARYLAAFAYILARVARADRTVDPEEQRVMERTVVEHGGLPEEQAILVVQIAKTQNLLFGGTEDFLVTREFKKISTRDNRLALLDCLFVVAAAHEEISTPEDNEIRRISIELDLEHSDFIAIRSRYRDRLSVLRKKN